MTHNEKEKQNNSERKHASLLNEDIVKKYIDLFDRLPIGIYRTTPDGKILTANPAFLSLLGYNNLEDLEGIDAGKTHKSQEARNQFIKEIEEKGEVYAKESLLVHSQGNEITVEEYARVYRNTDGETLFYEGVVIDISEKIKDRNRISFLNGFKELILNLTTLFINIRLADIDDKIVHSLRSIGDFMGADRSYVFLFDDNDMQRMSNTHEALADGVSSVINELQELDTTEYPWWMDNLKKNKAIIVPDVSELPSQAKNEKTIFTRQNIQSLFAVPMFFDYRLIGFLGFDIVRTRKIVDNDTLELLNIAASLFANILNYQKTELEAIENNKLLEELIKQRTQDLANVNNQLRDISGSCNNMFWNMDMNLQITYISPSVFKQLGYTPEEYQTLPFEKRHPRKSIVKIKELIVEGLKQIKADNQKTNEHSIVFEMLYFTKNNNQIWGEVIFNLLLDTNGTPTGIHGISRNIHDSKMAELALWESNERFRALVENTSDWIWEVDAKNDFTYTSPICEKITGYSPEELTGKPFTIFIASECLENATHFFLNSSTSKKAFRNYENTAIHKKGRKVYIETSGIPIFDINDNFIGFRGITRDITEKKSIESALRQSQIKFTQHLRNTPMGYIEWDNNLEVIEWNPSAQKIFGYNKAEAMIENMIEKLVPIELRNEVLEVFPTVFTHRKPVHKINHCLTREGKTILCEWFNTPLTDEADNIIGLASLVREIRQDEQVF